MFRHLSSFLKKNKFRYIGGILILLLVDVFQLIVPQIMKSFTDRLVQPGADASMVWNIGITVLALAIGIGISRFLWRILIVITSLNFETWIRFKLFKHLVKLPREYFNRHKTGDLMAHATNDIQTIRQAFGFGVIMSVDAIFLTISTVVVMIVSIDLRLTLIALIPMPIIAISVIFIAKIIHRKFRAVQEAFSLISDKVQESFAGIRVIKAFSQEQNDLADFNEKNKINFDRNMSLAKTHSFFQPMVTFIGAASSIIGVAIGSRYVLRGTISVGDFVAFIQYLDMLIWPMMAFGMFTNVLQRGSASINRINVLLDEQSNLVDIDRSEIHEHSDIKFNNLSFTYPGEIRPTLKDIDLHIPAGSSLGIIGRTGSGKTTLINLLLRLYNVDRNMLSLGGVDINDLSIKKTREYVGAVPQDLFLFSNRIKDNIALSTPDVDEKRVIESAESARVHEEIMGFPKGYDTFLGEKGVNLSGGQRQRTAMARLLYKDSPVLIFDDSLSAVDTKTEAQILDHIQGDIGSHTSIVISHRVSTLKNLDNIIFMDEGRIIEQGTHQELLALGGAYYEINQKQQLEEKIKGE